MLYYVSITLSRRCSKIKKIQCVASPAQSTDACCKVVVSHFDASCTWNDIKKVLASVDYFQNRNLHSIASYTLATHPFS